MNYLKNYFSNKNTAFYIAVAVAAASVVVGIAYACSWIKEYESVASLVLLIVGAIGFFVLSVINPNIGAAFNSGCSLLAFALYTGKTFSYITTNFATGVDFKDSTVIKIILFAVLMFALFVASNVFVYVNMKKNNPTEENRDE